MAIAVDQASIGYTPASGSQTTVAFNTTATVASGGFIVVCAFFWASGNTFSSVAGGSLTWTIDKQGHSAGPTNPNLCIASAQAPTGLASGTTITATFSATSPARGIGGMSFTGVASSTPVDTTANPIGANSTAWTTGNVTIAAGSVLVGACYQESTNATKSTITAPSTEVFDDGMVSEFGATAGYRIESSAGAYAVAGTWAGTVQSATLAVAYLAAAGGPAAPPVTSKFSAIPLVRGSQ